MGKLVGLSLGGANPRPSRGFDHYAGALDWGQMESLKGGKTGRIEAGRSKSDAEQKIRSLCQRFRLGSDGEPERWENL